MHRLVEIGFIHRIGKRRTRSRAQAEHRKLIVPAGTSHESRTMSVAPQASEEAQFGVEVIDLPAKFQRALSMAALVFARGNSLLACFAACDVNSRARASRRSAMSTA